MAADEPDLRQKLHAATGDRDAEAKAVADRADDVSEDAAKVAVRKEHGDLGPGSDPDHDLATAEDARSVEDS